MYQLSNPRDKHILLAPKKNIYRRNENYRIQLQFFVAQIRYYFNFTLVWTIHQVKRSAIVYNRSTINFQLTEQQSFRSRGDCRCVFIWSFGLFNCHSCVYERTLFDGSFVWNGLDCAHRPKSKQKRKTWRIVFLEWYLLIGAQDSIRTRRLLWPECSMCDELVI